MYFKDSPLLATHSILFFSTMQCITWSEACTRSRFYFSARLLSCPYSKVRPGEHGRSMVVCRLSSLLVHIYPCTTMPFHPCKTEPRVVLAPPSACGSQPTRRCNDFDQT